MSIQSKSRLLSEVLETADGLQAAGVISKRRDALAEAAQTLFEVDLADRRLDFGSAAAHQYALVRAQRQRSGRPISTEDAQIAAVALASGATLVTRNTKDFADIDALPVINPWQDH